MKVIRPQTIIELDDDERKMLETALCVAEEICNDAVRQETLSGLLVRSGLDTPRQAGHIREFVSSLKDEL